MRVEQRVDDTEGWGWRLFYRCFLAYLLVGALGYIADGDRFAALFTSILAAMWWELAFPRRSVTVTVHASGDPATRSPEGDPRDR